MACPDHDSRLLGRIQRQLESDFADSAPVLFTGAGFSRAAVAASGRPIPSTPELEDLLWPIAFPHEAQDDSTIVDIYACAVRADPARTGELLRRHLCVDPESLPDGYRTWFSAPWARIYTLNVDDLDEAVGRRFELPQPLHPVSALEDALPTRGEDILSIHLNGRIAGFPNITFSLDQYGQRAALPDPWYQHLAIDLAERPFLFVGTRLNEPPLWQQLALRLADEEVRTTRPMSYLVSSRLPVARRRLLEDLNVEWLPMDQACFGETVLAPVLASSGDR